MNGTPLESRFFLVGPQRTGTTLMRLILDCHSRIRCHDEHVAFRVLADSAPTAPDRELVGFKVPQLTEQLCSASEIRDDALMRQPERAAPPNPYRGQRVLFMIRDVRDTVISMLGLAGWLERFGGPVLDVLVQQEAFRNRYAVELRDLETSAFKPVIRAALIWRYKADALLEYEQRRHPVLVIQYEQLVTQPRTELATVCRFLDIPWEPSLLEHSKGPHRELRMNGRAVGGTQPTRAIDTTSIGQWRHRLAREHVGAVLRIAGDVQDRFYGDSCNTEANRA